MTVIDYATEEVRRQGHDIYNLDGIERVGWMLDGWCYALRVREHRPPRIEDVEVIGGMVEVHKNRQGIRTVGVRVGSEICPPSADIPAMLTELFASRHGLTPIAFYKEFEQIHPFVDGNGRTGKILLNWLNGTLLSPIFPPNDLFGRWIENP